MKNNCLILKNILFFGNRRIILFPVVNDNQTDCNSPLERKTLMTAFEGYCLAACFVGIVLLILALDNKMQAARKRERRFKNRHALAE